MTNFHNQSEIIQDLGDGLVLRRASAADAGALSEFNARVHSDDGPDKPDERIAAWTRDLMERPHPTSDAADFTIVEDIHTGEIVSSMNLIPQTWSYAGIPIEVGRPELVGTAPEYRKRGLVRAQFEVIHQWSRQRGHMLQAITGIPYYYRQFGYEMGLNMGGGRIGYKAQVPALKEGELELYEVRPVDEADLPFINALAQRASGRYLMYCVRDVALWRYEWNGRNDHSINRRVLRLVQTQDGVRVGFLAHPPEVWRGNLISLAYELKEGLSWDAVTPGVIRYLYQTGESYAERDGKSDQFSGFGFYTGLDHPVHHILHSSLPKLQKPYAWYVRVAQLPEFLLLIKPALDERLANSPFAGHSGELEITFFRGGLRMLFSKGRLRKVERWQPAPHGHSGDASFPDLTFLQLLLGYRSLDELSYAFADCRWKNDSAFGLLQALFPKMASDVWPVS